MEPRARWLIDVQKIEENAKKVCRFAGKSLAAVVKADAYGHGAKSVAAALEKIPCVAFLAVATPAEGALLREAGVTKPILVLSGFLPEEIGELKRHRLTPCVSTKSQLLAVLRKKIPYHLVLDTGMGRLGFRTPPYALLNLRPPEGVMTHFPSAETDRRFTLKQIARFKRLIKPLRARWIHLQNTAGLGYKIPYANLVRVGLALYGEAPPSLRGKLKLLFPSKVEARIVSVKRMPAGSCISYGCRYKTKKNSWIGVISFGYADGLPRAASGRAKVFYKDQPFPVAGNVTMDLTAVDFGSVKPREGESVILIFERQKFSDLAAAASTIPYEIVTRIGSRVKRLYAPPKSAASILRSSRR